MSRHAHPLVVLNGRRQDSLRFRPVAGDTPFEKHLAVPTPGMRLLDPVGDGLRLLERDPEVGLGGFEVPAGEGSDPAARWMSRPSSKVVRTTPPFDAVDDRPVRRGGPVPLVEEHQGFGADHEHAGVRHRHVPSGLA